MIYSMVDYNKKLISYNKFHIHWGYYVPAKKGGKVEGKKSEAKKPEEKKKEIKK